MAGARIVAYSLGADKGSPMNSKYPLDQRLDTNPAEKMQNFHHASALSGIFEDPAEGYSSTILMRWLLAQPSTVFAECKKTPDMRIHPHQHSSEKLEDLRKIYHVHKSELSAPYEQVNDIEIGIPPSLHNFASELHSFDSIRYRQHGS